MACLLFCDVMTNVYALFYSTFASFLSAEDSAPLFLSSVDSGFNVDSIRKGHRDKETKYRKHAQKMTMALMDFHSFARSLCSPNCAVLLTQL